MERTYLTSWIASVTETLKRIALLFILANVFVRPCLAETLKGVVYSNSSGASASGAGMIRFAVGDNRVDDLDYGKPLTRKFSSPACSDIGAIWSVEVRDAGTILSAECDGKVDEWAHGPWLLLKEFFERLRHGSATAFNLFSSRWQASTDSQQYQEKLKGLDFSKYASIGTGAQCLEVVRIERPENTTIQTGGDCAIQLQRKYVDMSFDIVQNKTTKRFEIDNVEIR